MKEITRIFKITIILVILLFILNIKAFAYSEGDEITFDGITTIMPEITVGLDEDDDAMSGRKTNNYSNNEVTQNYSLKKKASQEDLNTIASLISKYQTTLSVVGIDVSYFQKDIDWAEVAKSGVKFAILRCGFRGYGDEGNLREDDKFNEYVKGALDNGIYVGVYFFSTAKTEEEALQEAVMTVDMIKSYNIQYPVMYDFEMFDGGNEHYLDSRNVGMSTEQINKNAQVFLDYVASKGYKTALYSNVNGLNNIWNATTVKKYNIWVAHYGVSEPGYTGSYQMWQCTSSASVPGIEGNVDVNIDYKFYNATPFTDIRLNGWYYEAVKYVYQNKIFYGTTSTTFAPGTNLTRGMLVTVLWRMEGCQSSGVSSFKDINSSSYYYNAVNWAASTGVVHGYNANSFGPNDKITREQLAVMLKNYAAYKGFDVSTSGDISKFTDYKNVSSYAIDAVKWAVSKGIINGKENGTMIDPKGNASRAEAAAMLTNYCKNVLKK